eukprot:tig00001000_g6187.t1
MSPKRSSASCARASRPQPRRVFCAAADLAGVDFGTLLAVVREVPDMILKTPLGDFALSSAREVTPPLVPLDAAGSVVQNGLFLFASSAFLAHAASSWHFRQRDSASPSRTPPEMPPTPDWLLPLYLSCTVALPGLFWIFFAIIKGEASVTTALLPYLAMVLVQSVAEGQAHVFRSPAWALVPLVYGMWRFWQIYAGMAVIAVQGGPAPVAALLDFLMLFWIGVFGMHLLRLPYLLDADLDMAQLYAPAPPQELPAGSAPQRLGAEEGAAAEGPSSSETRLASSSPASSPTAADS